MRTISAPTGSARPDDDPAARVRAHFAALPRPPADPARFTPDLYPAGPPLVPASGVAPDPVEARALLAAAAGAAAADRFDDRRLAARAPDPGVRAGLAALTRTVAEPVLDAFVAGALAVDVVTFGAPASPARVVGPAAEGPAGRRVVNDRYVAEHPVLLAPSLAHDLCWRSAGAGKIEETLLHAVAAMVHVQRLAAHPVLSDLRTELARRQHSLALTLLLSRRPGSDDVCLVAPDGPGTLPGGDPAYSTPDFWSVPFGAGPSADPDAPPVLVEVLRRVFAAGTPLPDRLRYDDDLVALCARPLGTTWCSPLDRWRVAVALGLGDP